MKELDFLTVFGYSGTLLGKGLDITDKERQKTAELVQGFAARLKVPFEVDYKR